MKRKARRACASARAAWPDPRRARARLCAVVRSLDEARGALSEARERGLAATLVSPPGAAAYLGVGFFAALVEAARAEFADVAVEGVMDCGDDPGWALSALRVGFTTIVLRGDPRARVRVAAIARAMGARLLRRPPQSGAGRRRGGKRKRKITTEGTEDTEKEG